MWFAFKYMRSVVGATNTNLLAENCQRVVRLFERTFARDLFPGIYRNVRMLQAMSKIT